MIFMMSDLLLWSSLIFYSACFIPQLFENYKIKSARGLSDWFIWCYFNDYYCILLYVWCQPFVLAYRIMVPVECVLMLILLYQRFYYDGVKKSAAFFYAVLASVLWMIGLLFLIPAHAQLLADLGGWTAFTLFTVSQIPQIIKIYRSKSTYGFSFGFVTIFALAQVCELIGGIIEKVPAATIVMCVRGLLFYCVYAYLFAKYRKQRVE